VSTKDLAFIFFLIKSLSLVANFYPYYSQIYIRSFYQFRLNLILSFSFL